MYTQRCDRHGWGDTSLIKDPGTGPGEHQPGQLHRHGQMSGASGKGQPGEPHGKDGRTNLFGVLQMTGRDGTDSWLGHPLIDPTKGKAATQGPVDPKGRDGLFDVLGNLNPGA